jgi:hypothetical protein
MKPLKFHKAALVHPSFGLAWSNPNADEATLLRIAMLKGRFNAILESAVVGGIPFVRENLDLLKQRGALNAEQTTKLERMLKGIHKGFEQAMDDLKKSMEGPV